MNFKKLITTSIIACTAATFLVVGTPKKALAASLTVNNYGFESVTNNRPDDWNCSGDLITATSENAQYGSKCLKIVNSSKGYSVASQKINLKPNTGYKLTGYIKGTNISQEISSDGAAILVGNNSYIHVIDSISNWKNGTFGWTKVTVYFETTSITETTIECRLGHYWGGSSGTAYFDNIQLEECTYPNNNTVQRVRLEGKHIVLAYTKNFVNGIGMDKYQKYLERLDAAYEKYAELTGSTPRVGDKIYVVDTMEPFMRQYGAIANFNPILINPNLSGTIQDMLVNDTTGFGILHEIGHIFDEKHGVNAGGYAWNFESEFWANTKMLYVLDETDDVSVNIGDLVSYSSDDIKKYYKEIAGGGYDNTFEKGTVGFDGMSYLFIKLKEKVGWDTFKKAFRFYTENKVDKFENFLGANSDRFFFFLSILQYYYNPTGREVFDVFGERDINTIMNYYNIKESDLVYFPIICEHSDEFTPIVNGTNSPGLNTDTPVDQIRLTSVLPSLLQYQVCTNGKWSDWLPQGTLAGEKGSPITGIGIRISDDYEFNYDIEYSTDGTNWTSNGYPCTCTNGLKNLYIKIETCNSPFCKTNILKLKNPDGTTISTFYIADKAYPRFYTIPDIEGLMFKQLSDSIENITSDTDLIAQYENCDKVIIYYKGVDTPIAYYKYTDGSMASYNSITMDYSSGFNKCEYSTCINVEKGKKISAYFVGRYTQESDLNDYVLEPGVYTIINKKLTKVDSPDTLRIKRFYPVNSLTGEACEEKIFDADIVGGKGPVKYKYTKITKDGEEHVLRDYCEYSRFAGMFETDIDYIVLYATDGYTTESKRLGLSITDAYPLTLGTFQSSEGTNLKVGQKTTITFRGLKGYGDYRYTLKINGKTVLDDSEKNSYELTPQFVGRYTIEINIRDCRGNTLKKKAVFKAS